ncbi:Gfo/Idh/MocA family oxidoreductase [Candidatus Woesearchaeota archaeon]|nr:Gfo/Idh/MocA family oxidoreductase [Candidatus Woesearchaeota archaeon]
MVNLAVIGVGVMGTHHARVLSNMENVSLVAISDVDETKLDAVGNQFNIAKRYKDHGEMLKNEKLDGVVVAVQPLHHKKIVFDCIDAGVNVLLEKPISHDLEEAQEIIEKAKEKNVVLLVGHIERFNPVVTKMKEFIDAGNLGDIYLVNSVRIGPFPKRLYGLQEGVLIDISVHDIDIIRYLAGEITQVYSQLLFSGNQEIYAKSVFKIGENARGSSEFSWISPKRLREIEIYGLKGMLKADYFAQELTFHENNDAEVERSLEKGTISAGKIVQIPIVKQEPLRVELSHFIDCIKNNKKPLISPEDAKRAVEISLAIMKSNKENNPVNV